MDEERSALAVSPEPPDDGDPAPPAPHANLHATSTAEKANSCPNPKPCPSPGKEEVALEKHTVVLTWLFGRNRFCVLLEKQVEATDSVR